MSASAAEVRILGAAAVRALLPYAAAVPLMRRAMIALSRGETRQTLRQILDLPEGWAFGVMPGASPWGAGAKLLGVAPKDLRGAAPSHQGVVILFDAGSGAPRALLEASALTEIRTAAATAAASDVLARADASRLLVLGAGAQAESHLRALPQVRAFETVRVWARRPEAARALAQRLAPEIGREIVCETDLEGAVRASDLICAVTAAAEPVLSGAWVAPGAHVNLVGSSRLGPREADDALIVRARVFADHREGVLAQGAEHDHARRAGLIDDGHVLGEIGEVMDGRVVGRAAPQDVTLYKSLGSIVQDLAAAAFVLAAAEEADAGTSASLA